MPWISAPRRQRQGDFCEFKDSLELIWVPTSEFQNYPKKPCLETNKQTNKKSLLCPYSYGLLSADRGDNLPKLNSCAGEEIQKPWHITSFLEGTGNWRLFKQQFLALSPTPGVLPQGLEPLDLWSGMGAKVTVSELTHDAWLVHGWQPFSSVCNPTRNV